MRTLSVSSHWRCTVVCLVLGVALSGSATAEKEKVKNREAAKELMEGITVALPAVETLGRYEGPVRIALGEVVDRGYAETEDFLGVGPNATFKVTLASTRIDSVRQAVAELLAQTGLEAATAEGADYRLDVTIRRDRFSFDGDRLRGEVFLDFEFRRGDGSAGRVLAYGNAEANYASPQFTGLKKVRPVYESAFHDALYKLVDSEVFRRVVGGGWTPGARTLPLDEEIGRIDQDFYYLPTEPWPEIEELATALAGREFERLVVQDFAILDEEFLNKARKVEKKVCGTPTKRSKKARAGETVLTVYTLGLNKLVKKKDETWACDFASPESEPQGDATTPRKAKKKEKKAAKEARVAHVGTSIEASLMAGVRPRKLACECLPALIQEHLEAYYPHAFDVIERRAEWQPAEALVVTGEIHRFNMGSANTRLEADIHFKDGRSGETLYTLPVRMGGGLNWATGLAALGAIGAAGASGAYDPTNPVNTWRNAEVASQVAGVAPAMRDMEDDVARAAAYLLVAGLLPDYEPPADLEIAFDERSRRSSRDLTEVLEEGESAPRDDSEGS